MRKVLVVFAAVVALSPRAAFAQPAAGSPVSVSFGSGAVSTSSATRVTFAGAINVQISDRASIEGETRYLDRGPGADGLAATGTFLVDLMKPQSRVVPFAMVGGGIYRASFDMNHPAFMGDRWMQFMPTAQFRPWTPVMPGSGFMHGAPVIPVPVIPSAMHQAGYGYGFQQMPMFYASRMGAMTIPQGGMWERRSFTDPAMAIGGGVRLRDIGHLTLRADARALVLFANGDTHTLGVFGFNVGYRF